MGVEETFLQMCHLDPDHFSNYESSIHFFFYKQVFYKQPQAQIAENLSTLLSTLSASDLVQKVPLLEKVVASCKKYRGKYQNKANLLTSFSKIL